METPAVADIYELALELTAQMLDAARKADWERLVRVEIQRGRLFDQIRAIDPAGISQVDAIRRRQVIEQILASDKQTKLLTHDWMHELRDILGSATAQRLLNKTYDTESSSGG